MVSKCIIKKEDIQVASNLRKDSKGKPPCSRINLTKTVEKHCGPCAYPASGINSWGLNIINKYFNNQRKSIHVACLREEYENVT